MKLDAADTTESKIEIPPMYMGIDSGGEDRC